MPPANRLAAIDTARGLVMLMMLAEVLRLPRVAAARPDSPLWQWLGWAQTHAAWRGLSPHDLIQPMFSFLVGTALPFSLAARRARGESVARLAWHAAFRALVLVLLGVFLRSLGRAGTNTTFEDTLSQIGLGYLPLFGLAFAPRRWQLAALGVTLGGYFLLFAAWPLPGPDFDWASVGVPPDWPHPSGFAAHWDKNSNPAATFDRWLLNHCPRTEPFLFNRGGYATLSFVPTLGTMLLGLFAGERLRADQPWGAKLRRLVFAGLACLAAGIALDRAGICPSVKRIWTPSWVLVSAGVCYLALALLALITDVRGYKLWAFPLVVVGANSIAAYLIEHVGREFTEAALIRHLGRGPFVALGPAYEPLLLGAATLAAFWLLLLWMWQSRAFLRI